MRLSIVTRRIVKQNYIFTGWPIQCEGWYPGGLKKFKAIFHATCLAFVATQVARKIIVVTEMNAAMNFYALSVQKIDGTIFFSQFYYFLRIAHLQNKHGVTAKRSKIEQCARDVSSEENKSEE